MELISAETSLVIAGAWNPAILTPQWVLKHGLGKDGPDQRVQVFIPAAPNMIFEAPRYALDELAFSVQPNAVVLSPSAITMEKLHILEDAAARTLAELRHTPVSGVGHNFEFRDQDPSAKHLEVFTKSRQDLADRMPGGWDAAAVSIAASFKNAAETVFMNMTRKFDAGCISVKFNFHHPVSSIDQVLAVLKGERGYPRMTENLQMANSLIATLYGGRNGDGL